MKPLIAQTNAGSAVLFSDYIDVRVLASNVAETVTVPTGAAFVVFNSTTNFYANANGTAAVPAADVTNGTGSELNPASRYVANVSTFSVIAPTDSIITMAWYSAS